MVRAFLAWLLILVLAIVNGAFRQALLLPRLGEKVAHVISTLLLSLMVLFASWLLIPWVRPAGMGDAWLIGASWVILTVGFEFLAGHYVFGTPWERLLGDYNVADGRIWILVLVAVLLGPVLVVSLRGT